MTANVGTIAIIISEREVAERPREILDRSASGERITIERDGTAIAVFEAAPPIKKFWVAD